MVESVVVRGRGPPRAEDSETKYGSYSEPDDGDEREADDRVHRRAEHLGQSVRVR